VYLRIFQQIAPALNRCIRIRPLCATPTQVIGPTWCPLVAMGSVWPFSGHREAGVRMFLSCHRSRISGYSTLMGLEGVKGQGGPEST
jgi:hypothetical protein